MAGSGAQATPQDTGDGRKRRATTPTVGSDEVKRKKKTVKKRVVVRRKPVGTAATRRNPGKVKPNNPAVLFSPDINKEKRAPTFRTPRNLPQQQLETATGTQPEVAQTFEVGESSHGATDRTKLQESYFQAPSSSTLSTKVTDGTMRSSLHVKFHQAAHSIAAAIKEKVVEDDRQANCGQNGSGPPTTSNFETDELAQNGGKNMLTESLDSSGKTAEKPEVSVVIRAEIPESATLEGTRLQENKQLESFVSNQGGFPESANSEGNESLDSSGKTVDQLESSVSNQAGFLESGNSEGTESMNTSVESLEQPEGSGGKEQELPEAAPSEEPEYADGDNTEEQVASGAAQLTDSRETPTSEHESTSEGEEDSELTHAQKRKKLSKIVVEATKELAKKCHVNKKRGQHQFVARESVLPAFSKDLAHVLNYGSKQAIAAKYNEIAREIVNDMHTREGSGNKKYYTQLRRELMLEYPELDNALLRNNYRRILNPKVTNADLSEDTDEEIDLRPQTDESRRTFTKKGKCLDSLTKVVGRMNRNLRKKTGKMELVQKAIQYLEVNGFTKLGDQRWERAGMPLVIDADSQLWLTRVKHRHDASAADIEFVEGYTKTFSLRTKAIKRTGATLTDMLNVYPLLKFEKFLQVEAECYLGSNERYLQFFSNVHLAWKGIGNLNKTKTTEENFKETVCVLGPLMVLFSSDEHLIPHEKHPWPYVVHTPRQTLLRFQHHDFLDICSLKKALGYLVLLLNMFDLPTKSRPQLLLLLESLFFGYQAPYLSNTNTIFMNKITDLAQQPEWMLDAD